MINMVISARDAMYEETLENVKMTFGRVPGFLNFMPKENLVREWPSLRNLSEIDLERASCLLCFDTSSGIA